MLTPEGCFPMSSAEARHLYRHLVVACSKGINPPLLLFQTKNSHLHQSLLFQKNLCTTMEAQTETSTKRSPTSIWGKHAKRSDIFCSVQSVIFSLSPAKQMSKSGHKDMDRIQMNEWMKEQKKILVLCNTRVEEGWRDEAGLVSEGRESEGSL